MQERVERAHLSLLLEEHLQEENVRVDEWSIDEGFEKPRKLSQQREEEQGSDCPLAVSKEYHSELGVPSSTGEDTQRSGAATTYCSWGGTVCLPDGVETEAMQSKVYGYMKTGTFLVVGGVERRKHLSSKWCFNFGRRDKSRDLKGPAIIVARGFTQIRNVDYTHSSPLAARRQHPLNWWCWQ